MGIFWDLIQQDELEKQKNQADSLDDRVEQLEKDMATTRALLRKTLEALESHTQTDIDGDGNLG